jgi:gliding motility-associated-like protein
MKKISILLLIFIAASTSSFASHYVGGEIYWRCIQGTGKYIFYMDYYRDCNSTSADIGTGPVFLKIYNTPLPNNGALNQLMMTFVPPDPGTPLGPNGGASVAPLCTGCANSSQPISCVTEDRGTLEKYSYRSQPVTLNGKPPSAGWVFGYTAACCRSGDVKNLSSTGTSSMFKAIMYGDGRPSQDPCYDSSPQFKEAPSVIICEGYDFQFNHNATDDELDSLSYHWANVVNSSSSATQYVPVINNWGAGYSLANPTPTPAMNPLNKSATIDPLTGEIRLFTILPANVPANIAGIYVTSAQVDAWGISPTTGQRVKTGTIFRDMPFNIFRCPRINFTYNDVNGNPQTVNEVNKPPFVQIGATSGSNSLDTIVYAGDLVSISFLAVDTNISPCSPTLLTEVSVEPTGYQFDKSFNDPQGNCPIKPCATLTPPPTGAPVKRLRGLSTVGTKFNWQTTCDHLNPVGIQQLQTGRFTFVMKVYDDFCPVPAINYPTINITLKAPEPIGPPVIRCVSIQEDGSYVITWTGPVFPDTTNSFNSYELFMGQRPAGTNVNFSFASPAPIAIGLTAYEGSYTVPANAFAPGTEYAFKMKSRYGCGGLLLSGLSELATTNNRVKATHSGTLPVGDPNAYQTKVTLNWKSLFNTPANYNPNRNPLLMASSMLESWDGKFYIYQRHTPHNAGPWNLIDSILETDTSKFKWTGESPVCDDSVSFKIMTRDTLANCESFSNVVTKNMKSINPPTAPRLLETSVRANGDVFLKWSIFNTSADAFVIYQSNAAGVLLTKLDSIMVPQDTFIHVGAGSHLAEKYYVIIPYDTCNKTVPGLKSKTIKTSLSSVALTGNCIITANITWQPFLGFENPITQYDFYSVVNNVTTKIGTRNVPVTSFDYIVGPQTTYDFYVVAKTALGLSARSSLFNIVTGSLPDTFVIASPDIRCVRYVGGVVELEWIKPENPKNNFENYRVERLNGANWGVLPGGLITDYNITTFTDGSPLGDLKYRIVSVSNYCNQSRDSILSGYYVSPIKLTGTSSASGLPEVDLTWTDPLISYINPFEILRDTNGIYVENTRPQGVFTYTSKGVCGEDGVHTIQVEDTSGCFSISNTTTTAYVNGKGPDKQFIDYVTVIYSDINNPLVTIDNPVVKVVWSPNSADDVAKYKVDRPLTLNPVTNITQIVGKDTLSITDNVALDDTTYTYIISALDSCNADSDGPFDRATTIDIDSKFLICDSTVELTWNNYEWFRSGAQVIYEVYYSQTKVFADFAKIGNTTRNEFTHEGVLSGDNYYYVKAVDLNGAGPFFSISNLTEEFVEYPDPPAFQYMHSVFVNSPSFIEIQCYVDTMALVKGYEIFRGLDSSSMVKLDQVGIDEVVDGFVHYEDYNVVTSDGSYYYRINALDSCGNLSIASNLGKSILLTNTTDNLALTNTLKWSAYEDWRNGVSHYLIYKAENNKFGVDAFDTLYVEPNMGDVITYIDDVSNYSDSKTDFVKNGQYCYYVVAVENGKGVPTDPNITPGMALSNAVCTNMQPTMYIPNAFSPGTGVNNVFRPEGIYFDFTRYEMIIYNRWGEVVFESTDYYKGWDGALSGGTFAPIGTYVYTIRFIDSNGQERSKKGTLTIVR